MYSTKFLIGFKKYLFKTNEKIKITNATIKAVLIIKIFLSFIATLISLAFSVMAKKPILILSILTFLIVVNKN